MPHHDDNDEWIKELGRRKGAFGSQAIGTESGYYGPGEAGMPFKSQAQRRKFAELLVAGKISNETFEEWNRETGSKRLPERVRKKPATRKKANTRAKARTASKR